MEHALTNLVVFPRPSWAGITGRRVSQVHFKACSRTWSRQLDCGSRGASSSSFREKNLRHPQDVASVVLAIGSAGARRNIDNRWSNCKENAATSRETSTIVEEVRFVTASGGPFAMRLIRLQFERIIKGSTRLEL